ncbi:uncharacterized protein LOC130897288 [Diorhabda carinulata]|uniref:uncharacterized protein LOC130897288 n=1 Tax=Diorhabda carinulata TaxID=1163345 RepID=UPI0025A2CD05|nr:uncharacterized protein LOC130897288 [Diorhabda carinulata]
MKYIYFIYFLIGYVAAEESLNLQALVEKCECNDIIDQILCKIAENTNNTLNLKTKLVKVVKKTQGLVRDLNDNTKEISQITTDVTDVENKQSVIVDVVDKHNATISSIDEKVDEILDNQEGTEKALEGFSCSAQQIKKTLILLQICPCIDEKCSAPTTTVGPR